jgi:CBS domain-containing protein
LTSAVAPLSALTVTGGSFIERLMVANLFLAAFNMLPAFPMDGGRVLRAALASRMEFCQATRVAARIGRGMAVLFGVAGLFANPYLLLIAVFVWTGATQEADAILAKGAVAGIPVSAVMSTGFHTVSPRDSLAHVMGLAFPCTQRAFPVVENDRLAGLLTRGDLLRGLSETGLEGSVSNVMRPVTEVVDGSETLATAYSQLLTSASQTLLVTQEGRLAGLLTIENLAKDSLARLVLGRATEPIGPVSQAATSAELRPSTLTSLGVPEKETYRG